MVNNFWREVVFDISTFPTLVVLPVVKKYFLNMGMFQQIPRVRDEKSFFSNVTDFSVGLTRFAIYIYMYIPLKHHQKR